MTDLRARLAAMKAEDALDAQRTVYVIRLKSGVCAGHNCHWVTQMTHAMQFAFMTSAIAYATQVLDLGTADYTVEAV